MPLRAATDPQEIALYTTPDGNVEVNVRLEAETVWLTRRQMAELFDTSSDNVGLHLKDVYAEGELVEAATTEESSVVQTERPSAGSPGRARPAHCTERSTAEGPDGPTRAELA